MLYQLSYAPTHWPGTVILRRGPETFGRERGRIAPKLEAWSVPGSRAPQGVRKVRASTGRVQDNVLSGQLEGKCHRNIPPAPFAAGQG
jgi:hypothetical protein